MIALLACALVPAAPEATAPAPLGCDLRLNEVQARNDSTWMDTDGSFPDWVELHNVGAEVDAELRVDDASAWTGSVAAGERIVVPLRIDADGARIELLSAGLTCDRLATGEMGHDTAWARVPDGGAWVYTGHPTPGWTNGTNPHPGTDPSDDLFPEGGILEFDLTLSESSQASLDADPYGDVEGALGWGPAWFPRVGVRLKGVYGSLRTLDGKAAFKIDLDAYEDRRLRGLESLTFNNMVQDPSYVHEALAYAFFREMGLPAPRTAWMRLRVNGEDWGLYLHVESVDSAFLARWYGDPSGRLYEGAYGVDLVLGQEESFEYDEGPEEDRSDLTAVATILAGAATDEAVAELDTLVDMDQVLDEIAVEVALLHWDGYTTRNNYRIYHDPSTNRFQMLPWGTDQTFTTDYYGIYGCQGALFSFCMGNRSCAARYEEALDRVADTFEATPLEDWMDADLDRIDAEIGTDWRGEYDLATVEYYRDITRATIESTPARLRAR